MCGLSGVLEAPDWPILIRNAAISEPMYLAVGLRAAHGHARKQGRCSQHDRTRPLPGLLLGLCTLLLPALPLSLLSRRTGQYPTPSPTCDRRSDNDGPAWPQCAPRDVDRGVKRGIRRGVILGTKERTNTAHALTLSAPTLAQAAGMALRVGPTRDWKREFT